ncbi:alpha/beta fold hydrolase [Chondromyces apiculatus]|uniref:Hydrolase, alpha/beta fold family n=1 Tax=Chondromyces apiculatus DSM 436 TaxID=1192034 RepID=A0A017SXJ1_9BACT|nr:alpha/beta hydrolase [Chondromyces apiculatus]EYF01477.1 hydrolase, alpha/beta fold family [Chondromyces apiculatus DSM 436]
MDIARIGDVDIHYEIFGEGEPVLLIMGLGSRGDSWTPMSRGLAAIGYKAIQFDNRDVGWSSLVENPQYEISHMAEDALGLLDHLKVEKARVIGISMGGMITQELLATHPERFRQAVLMATWPGGANAVQAAPDLLAPALSMRGDPEASQRAMLAAIAAPGFAEANPEIMDLLVEAGKKRPTLPAAMARQLAAVGRWSSWDRLEKIGVPTLVIHGDKDPLLPVRNGELIAARIPGAKLQILPGVGHLVPVEAPRETFGAIQQFFSEG